MHFLQLATSVFFNDPQEAKKKIFVAYATHLFDRFSNAEQM